MTVSFYSSSSSVVSFNAIEESDGYDLLVKETVLLSGDLAVDASTHRHFKPSFTCIDTSTVRAGLLALIGSSGTLVINGTSYANCYIRSFGRAEILPRSSYIRFPISFVQETTA